MSVEDNLARLRAGLDRTETAARAAAKFDGEHWAVRRYDEEGIAVFARTGDDRFLGGATDAQTEHIERNDPAAELRRIAAVRKVIEAYEQHEMSGIFDDRDRDGPGPDIWGGRQEAYELFFAAMAEAYAPEPGDSTT